MIERRAPVGWEPGSTAEITYSVDSTDSVVEGDLLASRAGAAYCVQESRPSPTIPGRFYLTVERLPYGCIPWLAPDVWPLVWHHRGRIQRER